METEKQIALARIRNGCIEVFSAEIVNVKCYNKEGQLYHSVYCQRDITLPYELTKEICEIKIFDLRGKLLEEYFVKEMGVQTWKQ